MQLRMRNTPNIHGAKEYLVDPLHRNALFLMAANVVAALFGFFFWLIVARFYPTEEVGLAIALFSAMMLLAVISKLGFDFGLIRFLPHSEYKRDMINSCLTIAGLFSVAAAIVFILGLNLWSPKLLFVRENWGYLMALTLFTTVITLTQLQGQVFIAFRSTQFIFFQSIINALKLPLVALLVGLGALGIFSSLGLASILAFAGGSLFILKLDSRYRPVPTIRRQVVNDLAHFSFGNYVASTLAALPTYVMPLIIIAVLTAESSAYFYIPFSITSVLGMVAGSTSFSLLAEGSYKPAMLRSQVIRAAKFASFFIIPGLLVLFVFGELILSLFGTDYAQNSLWLLWLFALSWLPNIINIIYMTVVRVQMKIKPLIYIDGSLAVLTIGISYALMKYMGLIGVGIAFLSAQVIVAMVVGPIMLKMAGIPLKSILKTRIIGDKSVA